MGWNYYGHDPECPINKSYDTFSQKTYFSIIKSFKMSLFYCNQIILSLDLFHGLIATNKLKLPLVSNKVTHI